MWWNLSIYPPCREALSEYLERPALQMEAQCPWSTSVMPKVGVWFAPASSACSRDQEMVGRHFLTRYIYLLCTKMEGHLRCPLEFLQVTVLTWLRVPTCSGSCIPAQINAFTTALTKDRRESFHFGWEQKQIGWGERSVSHWQCYLPASDPLWSGGLLTTSDFHIYSMYL